MATVTYSFANTQYAAANAFSTGGTQDLAAGAALKGGGFIAAWHTLNGTDFIDGAVFENSGAVRSTRTVVNTTINGVQTEPRLAGLADGNALLVFTDYSSGTAAVRFEYLSPMIGVLANDAIVNAKTVAQTTPDVAALIGGGFVVTWQEAFNASDSDIWIKVYNNAGAAVVTTRIAGSGSVEKDPHVTALVGGGFAVSWDQVISGQTQVVGQIFNASGTATSGVTTIDASGTTNDSSDIVGLQSGGYAVVYRNDSLAGGSDTSDVSLSVVNSAGVRQFVSYVTAGSTNAQTSPHVALMSNGYLAVTYNEGTNARTALLDQNNGATLTQFSSGQYPSTDIISLADGRVAVLTARETDIWENTFDLARSTTATTANEVLRGDSLVDIMYGNNTNNTLIGGGAADVMYGGAGDDAYEVTEAGDVVNENLNEGNDTVYSYLPDYTLPANVERLELAGSAVVGRGNGLANIIVGTSGNNTLVGGAGNDTMVGGAGNDAYEVTEVGDLVVENAGEGTDTIYAYVSYTLPANVERLEMQGSAAVGVGNALANTIIGTSGANTLVGGAGNDTLIGGAGNDAYEVTEAGDVVIENPGEGTDTVYSYINSYTLTANVERLELQGSAVVGSGNGLDNTIVGTSGANTLIGGAGADTLIGGAGDDAYEVTEAADVVVENAGEGNDTVYSYIGSYTLPANVERLELQGLAVVGTGNSANNTIVGNGVGNYINGAGGDDTLTGGGGQDTFYWLGPNAGRDVITDFNAAGGEVINLASAQFANYAAVQAATTQVGPDVVITLNTFNTLTLQNVTVGQLSSANFSFYSGPYTNVVIAEDGAILPAEGAPLVGMDTAPAAADLFLH